MIRPRLARADRGFALLIVLWFLVLLTLIATRLVGDTRGDLALARNLLVAAKAEALADAAVVRAIYFLGDPRPDQRWSVDGTARTLALPEGEATILVEDERTKINVNRASRELLAALFNVLGTDPDAADAAIDAILRRRGGEDGGGAPQAGGAAPTASASPVNSAAAPPSGGPPSGPVAGGAGAAGAAKGRPFVALEELAGLPQMNAALLAAARPYLTPYGESAEPDPKTAPPLVKRALEAIHRPGTGTGSGTATAALGAPTDQTQPQANGAAAGFQVIDAAGDAAGTQGATNAIFRIVAIVKTGEAEFRREAVVRIDPAKSRGYGVLAWQALPGPAPHSAP